jgi:signal transduction histidine kinase
MTSNRSPEPASQLTGNIDRPRLLATVAYALGAVAAALGMAQISIGLYVSGTILLAAAAIAFATPALLKRTKQYTHAALGIVICTYAAPLTVHLLGGNGMMPLPNWIMVAPMIALLLLGRRAAYRMTALSVATFIGLFLSDTFAWISYPHPLFPLQFNLLYCLSLVLQTIVLVMLFAVVFSAEKRARKRLRSAIRTVSHELRTPLSGLTGLAEILLQTELSAEQKEYVETIDLIIRDMAVITTELIENYQDHETSTQADLRAFNIEEQLACVVKLYSPHASSREIALESICKGDTERPMLGQPRQLRQVLINLTRNAIFHAQASKVSVCAENLGSGQFRFSVSDDGIGIGAELKASIFESTAGPDTSESQALGLAISRILVGEMGGTLELDCTSDQGCSLGFTIPLKPI